ncbi:MAG: hypothetical protein RLP98_13075 [Devosia sp.]
MLKLTALALLAGLATASVALPSYAQANIPGTPNNPSSGPDHSCEDEMGHMRSVNAFDIQGIQGQKIFLYPICEDPTVPGKNNYGTLFINGNVNLLRTPIARNATLMNALTAKGYDHNDVVSLRFAGGNSIYLYVHQRDLN